MSSNFSDQIKDSVSSHEFPINALNIPKEKSNKLSSDSSGNKVLSNSKNTCMLNWVETYKTNISLTTFKNYLQTILKIIISPEKLKKYDKYEDYYEESVRNEIIKDIQDVANEIKNLKDKEENELNMQKNMESMRLDIDSKYANLNEVLKQMKEMMKQYQERNNELLSQVAKSQEIITNLKEEINSLNLYIKEKMNNSIKNTSDTTLEEGFFKTGSPSIMTQKNNNEFPPLNSTNNSRKIIKNHYQIISSPKKNIMQKTEKTTTNLNYDKWRINDNLMKGSKSKSKSKNKSKILRNNYSKDNINSIYIINLKNQEKTKNNANKKI
jgi:hypothetical protein